MISESEYFPIRGFMLLPLETQSNYRGVDRHPFEPLLDEHMDSSSRSSRREGVWTFYPPGWRQEAYRQYEENSIRYKDDLLLLSSLEAARVVQQIIEPHLGLYEIIACEMWSAGIVLQVKETVQSLGYDVAYPGGDWYSAILNGILSKNAHSALVTEYGFLLNQFGLFSNANPIQEYVRRFKELVASEANSEFCTFHLSLV